jgi:hypothetical protein
MSAETALPMLAACNREPDQTPSANSAEADGLKLLDEGGNNLLKLSPEGATSLGIDTGERASYRSLLSDRSAQGQQQIASQLRNELQRVNAFDTSRLSFATRTSFEVVRSACKSDRRVRTPLRRCPCGWMARAAATMDAGMWARPKGGCVFKIVAALESTPLAHPGPLSCGAGAEAKCRNLPGLRTTYSPQMTPPSISNAAVCTGPRNSGTGEQFQNSTPIHNCFPF